MATPVDEIQLTWIPPNDTPIELNDPARGWRLLGALVDEGMPEARFQTSELFDQPGEVVESVKYAKREVDVPFAVVSDTGVMTLRYATRFLSRALSPLRGEGALRLTMQDGTQRELKCRYSKGMRPDIKQIDSRGTEWDKMVLTFRASDPFWYDVDATVVTLRTTATGISFFPMFADPADVGPHLSSSSVFSDFDVENLGDVSAWPAWRINGPGVDPLLMNILTGEVLDMSNNGGITIAAGEWIDIDTRPGYKTVTHSNGDNLFSRLTDASSLWPLVVGPQGLRVTVAGATRSSLVSLSFRGRHLIA